MSPKVSQREAISIDEGKIRFKRDSMIGVSGQVRIEGKRIMGKNEVVSREKREGEVFVLDEIPFQTHLEETSSRLGMRRAEERSKEFRRMVDSAFRIARPKALYRISRIGSRGEDAVVIDDQTFRSRVLAVNLQSVYRVFPFAVTSGRELEEWSNSLGSLQEKTGSEVIRLAVLGAALQAVHLHIRERHHPGGLSRMNPGSLEDWPLSEQKTLFSLLGETESSIGVRLKGDFLMEPSMSTSGIWFPSEENFENCMLCPMEDCPGRRAPYDRELYEKKYRGSEGGA